MATRNRIYKTEIPSRERVTKYGEYWRFIEWLATPTPLRNPKTQGEFAKENSLHHSTLSIWKLIEGFSDDLWTAVTRRMKDDIPDVVYALKSRIFKDGNPRAVELFIQWARDVMPTLVVKHEGAIDISDPKTKEIIDKVNKITKELL